MAHCLDLLLEDIGKQKWVAEVAVVARKLVLFLSNHHMTLAIYRKHSNLELLKPGKLLSNL